MLEQVLIALVCSIVGILPCFVRLFLGGRIYTTIPITAEDRYTRVRSRFTEVFLALSFLILLPIFFAAKPDVSWQSLLSLPGYVIATEWAITWFIPNQMDDSDDDEYDDTRRFVNAPTGTFLMPFTYWSVLITHTLGWNKTMWVIGTIGTLWFTTIVTRCTIDTVRCWRASVQWRKEMKRTGKKIESDDGSTMDCCGS